MDLVVLYCLGEGLPLCLCSARLWVTQIRVPSSLDTFFSSLSFGHVVLPSGSHSQPRSCCFWWMSHILIPFLAIITTCLTYPARSLVLAGGSKAPFHVCLCSWENTALVGASGEGLSLLSTVWKRQVETGLRDGPRVPLSPESSHLRIIPAHLKSIRMTLLVRTEFTSGCLCKHPERCACFCM